MNFQNFFIVGCPRSGTTMLQQALNRHSQIAIPPETAFFSLLGLSRRRQLEHLQRINDDLNISLTFPTTRLSRISDAQAFYEDLARLYVERIGKGGSVTHFGEKTPEHLSRLPRIRAVVPNAKVIYIFRDGRDVALSLRSLPWTSRDLYVNFTLWLYCCRLKRRAQQSGVLPIISVRYEDLVKDPEKELRAILAFIDLPYERQVAEAEGNIAGIPKWEYPWKARAIERIRRDRIGLWRQQLSTKELGILERWGGGTLRELGYELATDGRSALPWCFHAGVALKSLLWIIRRPGYSKHKTLWLAKQANKNDQILSQ